MDHVHFGTHPMKPLELDSRVVKSDQPDDAPSRTRQVVSSLLLLGIVPCVFFVIAFQLTKASGPQWLGTNFENSYPYLFNSLLIVKKKPPVHVDHPGTTTQLLGAVCLRLSKPGSKAALIDAVLENPEHFLKIMHRALLILSALAVWIFPWLVARWTNSPVRGILLQFPVLFFYIIFYYSIWYGSDLFLVVPSMAAVCVCVFLIKQREEGGLRLGTCLLAGAICGFGVTTKLTFFPLILITMFFCRGVRSLLYFVAGFVLMAAAILVPIYSHLARFFAWISALATHSGYYGGGEVGFARAEAYFPDIVQLLSGAPLLAGIPMVSTVAILVASIGNRREETESRGPRLALTALCLFFLQVISFLFIAKHANHHYLIPLELSTGLNLVLLYESFRREGTAVWAKALTLGVLCILVAAGLRMLVFGAPLVAGAPAIYTGLRAQKNEQLSIYKRVKERTKDAVRVDYYRSVSPEFALYFGNCYGGQFFSRALERKYPRALFYNIFTGRFDTYNMSVDQAAIIRKYGHLYFFGILNLFHSSLFTKLFQFDSQDLHEVDREGPWLLQEWTRR